MPFSTWFFLWWDTIKHLDDDFSKKFFLKCFSKKQSKKKNFILILMSINVYVYLDFPYPQTKPRCRVYFLIAYILKVDWYISFNSVSYTWNNITSEKFMLSPKNLCTKWYKSKYCYANLFISMYIHVYTHICTYI